MITINPKKSLRTEIFLYLLLGSLIPALIILIIYSKKLHENLHAVIINKAEDGGEVYRTDFQSLKSKFKLGVAALSKETFLIELLTAGEEGRDSLKKVAAFRKRTAGAEIFTIYNADGSRLVSTENATTSKLENALLDRIEKKKNEYLPVLVIFSKDKERGIRLDAYAPIVEPFYKYLQGILHETIFLDQKFIEALKQKSGVEVGLFYQETSFIYTSFAPPSVDPSIFRKLFQTRNVTVQNTLFIGRKPYHTILHPILNEDGTVFGAIGLMASEQIIGENLKLVQALFVIAFLGIIIFSLGFNYYSANKIIKPISNVVIALRKIADRDLKHRIKVDSQNEISELANSFNAMAEDLQNTTVSRDYLDNIFRSMYDTLVVLTPDFKILMANYAICDLLGYNEKELIGQHVSMIFVKRATLFQEIDLDSLIKNGPSSNIEKTYLSKFGRKIPVLFSSSVMLDKKKKVEGVACVAQDITELKLAEQAILEKEAQLIHAGRLISLGEMATGVAHELSQPLASIRSNVEGLDGDWENIAFSKAKIPEIVSKTLKQVERATRIINHMRNFAQAKEIFINLIDLSTPIKEGLSFFNEQAKSKDIQIKTEFEEGLPKLRVDARRLEQVVVNLLSNAQYAVDKKGESEDQNYQKKIQLRLFKNSKAKSVLFEVQDNGIGMTKKNVERCMEPFFTTKDVGEGNGLGLSIVSKIIREFGGSIEINSALHFGTTFRITLKIEI